MYGMRGGNELVDKLARLPCQGFLCQLRMGILASRMCTILVELLRNGVLSPRQLRRWHSCALCQARRIRPLGHVCATIRARLTMELFATTPTCELYLLPVALVFKLRPGCHFNCTHDVRSAVACKPRRH